MIFNFKKLLTNSFNDGNIDKYDEYAGVAEQADAQDLKSCEVNPSYRFDSGLRHHSLTHINLISVSRGGAVW